MDRTSNLTPELAKARARARTSAGIVIALGHVGLFFLAVFDALNITVPTEYHFLALLSDSRAWLFIHLFIGMGVIVSLVVKRDQVRAMSLSAGFMGTWGVFTLAVALTTTHPVSLAGPVLAITLAGVAYTLAGQFAMADPRGRE